MILCCGEALIDMLPRQTAQGETAFAPHAGGAVFNTALALGRLGEDAGFFCGLSKDMFGAQLAETLEQSGVATHLCPRLDRPTTLAFVTLVNGQARYAFYDENTAMRMLGPDMLPPVPPKVRALFFGGISLVSEPCGTAFETLCLRNADRVIMIDPNIRPGFVRDEPAYRARLARMFAVADIVKLSDEDLQWLMPGQPEAEAVAALHDQGVKLVLITRGADGASALQGDTALSLPARKITVVDTVGAGDTFNAGFLSGLIRQGVLEKSAMQSLPRDQLGAVLARAIAAAAITASRAGANPPSAADIDETAGQGLNDV